VKPRALLRAAAFAAGGSLALAFAVVPAAAGTKGGNKRACPKQTKVALPLSAHVTKKAAQAALAAAPKLYKELNVKGAKVVWSKVATAAEPHGGEVTFQCGKKIQARTIVVELSFPKEMPSASLRARAYRRVLSSSRASRAAMRSGR
jgi:hypothetical protein